jgi:hypothetical protein
LLRKVFFVTFAPEDASLIGTGCPKVTKKTAETYYPHVSAAALI